MRVMANHTSVLNGTDMDKVDVIGQNKTYLVI